jgi:raffinose/stachyose/melibiose transport system permease protein
LELTREATEKEDARQATRIGLWKLRTSRLWATVAAIVFSLFVLVPFTWVIFTSVKSQKELSHNPLGVPTEWQLGNFAEAWTRGHFDTYFVNSVLVAIPTVALVLVCSTLAAYAFSLMEFRGKNVLFIIFLVGLTIPLSILIIPLFYELLSLGLLNTYWALVLPQVAKTLPFGILLLRAFMEDFPTEILDAARIDGCSTWGLLYRVVVPISAPALASLLVFTFMWTWNQFVLPVVLIQDDAMRTLPVGLNFFQGRFVTDTPLMMAGAIISFLPIVLMYIIFQRQFIKGITAGAFK